MERLLERKILKICDVLQSQMRVKSEPVNGFYVKECDYKKNAQPPIVDETFEKRDTGCRFYGVDKHFWIYKNIVIPEHSEYEDVYLTLKTGREGQWDATNPQCLVYVDGVSVQGLDVNHTELKLSGEGSREIYIYLYAGMINADFYTDISLVTIDRRIEKLYYDLKVPCESLACFSENDEEYVKTVKYLNKACNMLDLRVKYSEEYFDSLVAASEYLLREFYEKECGKSEEEVGLIGHTHIDVAWRWTLAQTEEKAQRSFATVLNLMKQYPDYTFMSSQPQLYEYVKENNPELYARLKEAVKAGRFNPEGAMWLEADCNLTSGEGLVRQILFGKRFFREEFGVDNKILWLPDVFGYSSALPQILNKTGVDTFVTSKISWNDTNKLPYDAFMWEGLDGSRVFTTFITAQKYEQAGPRNHTTYCGDVTPSMVKGTRARFQQKAYTNRAMLTFGHGDGGGGPTKRMLEYAERLKYGLPGIPKATITPINDYIDRLKEDFMKGCVENLHTPTWVGELYLEFHRGTYTSMAKNKKNNRKSEFLLETAEQTNEIANVLLGKDYPKEEINKDWKLVLLNQFHDILPGSSIKEVYRDSDRDYAIVRESGEKVLNDALNCIAENVDKNEKNIVYNPNSFPVSDYVKIGDKFAFVENIPSMGYKTVKNPNYNCGVKISGRVAETPYYVLKLNENGQIYSLYDKENDRKIVKPGEEINRIEAFEDLPYSYDNWELSEYYKEKKWVVDDIISCEPFADGARAGFVLKWKFLSSIIEQKIILTDNSRRIDIENVIDWKESHIVLKAAFPLDIHSNTATYETQFGYVDRPNHENTSFDKAKYEVCAHKFADLSEDGYGVSILNDCKYGYNCEGSTLKLTLLKCGTEPNPNADKEIHRFTYSILPHVGNHRQGGTVREAYKLNKPLIPLTAKGDGKLENSFSMLEIDSENVIAETLKQSEDGNKLIVRAYEAYNRKSKTKFKFGREIQHAYLCDMLENKICDLEITDGNTVELKVSNFEIVTIAVEF